MEEKKDDLVKAIAEAVKAITEKEQKIVCPVCGHANKASNGLCEMCSNYLK